MITSSLHCLPYDVSILLGGESLGGTQSWAWHPLPLQAHGSKLTREALQTECGNSQHSHALFSLCNRHSQI